MRERKQNVWIKDSNRHNANKREEEKSVMNGDKVDKMRQWLVTTHYA